MYEQEARRRGESGGNNMGRIDLRREEARRGVVGGAIKEKLRPVVIELSEGDGLFGKRLLISVVSGET